MSYLFKLLGYKKTHKAVELRLIVSESAGNEIILLAKLGQAIGEIRLDDGRNISAKQRQRISRNIKDIADHLGYGFFECMVWLLYEFNLLSGFKYEHFEHMTVTDARKFINYLLEFIFRFDVALNESILCRIDNIDEYLYLCLKHKRCAICGGYGEVHHWDAIGMGSDRTVYDDSKLRKVCLCRGHHTEAHTIGREEFKKKYKVYGIIYITFY